MNRTELKKKRAALKRKAEKRRRVLEIGVKAVCAGAFIAVLVIAAKSGMLNDMPKEYTIPEGAISGGEYVGADGVTYERFQLGNKFYVLSKATGARIPQ